VSAFQSLLPLDVHPVPSIDFTHIEHELLARSYINDKTIYGDPIPEIPRSNFWASEDGYAWDMDELAATITSNGGVLRNPLSKQMFTASSIRFIISHPLGKRLGALQLTQEKLKSGVRFQTVEELQGLGDVFDGRPDQSDDQMPNRLAMERFLGYLATLAAAEQGGHRRVESARAEQPSGDGI